MATSVITMWELRLEELVASAYLVNFKAAAPEYKSQEAPVGISAPGSASGTFKKVVNLDPTSTGESYEFTINLENSVFGHTTINIGVPSATSWKGPTEAGKLFLRCDEGCRKEQVRWVSTSTSL